MDERHDYQLMKSRLLRKILERLNYEKISRDSARDEVLGVIRSRSVPRLCRSALQSANDLRRKLLVKDFQSSHPRRNAKKEVRADAPGVRDRFSRHGRLLQ